jgi:hypothetical protein
VCQGATRSLASASPLLCVSASGHALAEVMKIHIQTYIHDDWIAVRLTVAQTVVMLFVLFNFVVV